MKFEFLNVRRWIGSALVSLFVLFLLVMPVRAQVVEYLLYKGVKYTSEKALCQVTGNGSHGCCILPKVAPGPDGKGEVREEKCDDGQTYIYADCYCVKDGTSKFLAPGLERDSCAATCKSELDASLDPSQGVGTVGKSAPRAPGQSAPGPTTSGLCFTPSECAEAKGEFESAGAACPAGNGRCIAPEPEITLSSPLLGQAKVVGIRQYVDLFFRYLLSVGVVVAGIMFVYGGFSYITSSTGFAIGNAKETMMDAAVGLFLLFSCVLILNTINPETAKLPRIKVFMINTIQFSSRDWCKDYKSKAGASVKFADAGDPAGAITQKDAKYELDLAQTTCGKKFYPASFGTATCTGQTCTEKGKTCVACKGGFEECQGNKSGFACISAALAGTVTWTGHHYPKEVHLIPVCNNAKPNKFSDVKDNIVIVQSVTARVTSHLSGADKRLGDERGAGGFVIPGELPQIEKAKNGCNDQGGLRGFVLAVTIKDACTVGKLATATVESAKQNSVAIGSNVAVGGVSGAVGFATMCASTGIGVIVAPFCAVAGGLAGSAAGGAASVAGGGAGRCASNRDDLVIVTKQNCRSGGGGFFAGYSDGAFLFRTSVSSAIFCGWNLKPQTQPFSPAQLQAITGNGNGTFDSNADPQSSPFWSFEELQDVIQGKTDSLSCDLSFTDENAPSDPASVLLGGCGDGVLNEK